MLRSLKSAINNLINEYRENKDFFQISDNNRILFKSALFASNVNRDYDMVQVGRYIGTRNGKIESIFTKKDEEYLLIYFNGNAIQNTTQDNTKILTELRDDLFRDDYLFLIIDKSTREISDAVMAKNSIKARRITGKYGGYMVREISKNEIKYAMHDINELKDKYLNKIKHIDDILNKIKEIK